MLKINKMLIIENSKLFNNHLKKSLKPFTKEITQVYSFKEAKNILKEKEIHLILLDIELPNKNEIEFLEEIKSEYLRL